MNGKGERFPFALLLGLFLALGVSGETGMVPVEPGVDLFYRKIGSGPETLVVIMVAESLADDLAPLAEGGHFPHVEARETLIAALKTFLDGGWPV